MKWLYIWLGFGLATVIPIFFAPTPPKVKAWPLVVLALGPVGFASFWWMTWKAFWKAFRG